MEQFEQAIEKAVDGAITTAIAQVDAEVDKVTKGDQDIGTYLKKLDQKFDQLNGTLLEFKSIWEKDSSYTVGVLLMMSGGVLYLNSYESLWKTVGMVLAVGGISVVLK